MKTLSATAIAVSALTFLALPAVAQNLPSTTSEKAGPNGFPNSTTSEKAGPNGFPNSTTSEKAGPNGFPNSTTSEKAGPNGFPNSTTSEKSKPDAMVLTDAQAQSWIGKPVYSSDNKKLGSVTLVERDAGNKLTGLQADIGGFLGLGETRVRAMPAQFSLGSDRVTLNVPADAAKSLPQIAK